MNKKIRRIIALILAVSAFSTIEPTKYMNITGITKAYASSSIISNLQVNKNATDDELTLYEDEDYEDSVEFKSSVDNYYVKTSSSSVNLTFDTESNYVTKVFKDNSKTASPFDSGEEIDLAKGTNTLYVRTYKESKFDKNNVKNDVVEEYEVTVEKKTSSTTSDITLSKIGLDYGDISFSKSQTSYDVDVNSSVDEIEITAKPSKKSYTVTIDGDEVTDDDDYKNTVDLKKGKNEIEIKVTDEDDNENTYTLNIYRGGKSNTTTDSSDIDTTQDKIYLKDLTLNDGDVQLDFDKKVTKYDVKVDSAVSKLKITAEPQDNDDTVKINGSTVDSDSDYEKTISLDKNATKAIEVKVKNSDKEQRIYTLNVTRGTVSQTDANANTATNNTSSTTNNTNTNTNASTNTTTDANTNLTGQTSTTTIVGNWVKDTSNNRWKYYNDKGVQVKDDWFYYPSNNNWYYLDSDGYMKTGWTQKDSKWYYLDENGVMQIGWVDLAGTWYYLNADGSMRNGWLQEGAKKYYLNKNGAMQTGTTTIDGKEYTFDATGELSTTTGTTTEQASTN